MLQEIGRRGFLAQVGAVAVTGASTDTTHDEGKGNRVGGWKRVLVMDSNRKVTEGSPEALAKAIRNGADLRIGTEFIHNEHIDVTSSSAEPIREVAEFGVTYLVKNEWAGGIMSLRQPIELPNGFGPRPSMSFFLYNQDGRQAIARPYLDGKPASGKPGASAPQTPENMPKYHTLDSWDNETNAPSSNFAYDFNVFRYFVRDNWREVLSHGSDGDVRSGSIDALLKSFSEGCAIKVGVSGVCSDMVSEGEPLEHEVFVEAGSSYAYLEQRLFMTGSHPVVRVKPSIPLRYESMGWDFGWLFLRTDGNVVYRRCNPYTLKFEDRRYRCAVRWFVK